MRKHRILLAVLLVAFTLSFAACGSVVNPNEVALVLRTLGSRDAEVVGKKEAPENGAKKDIADNFEAELVTATRAPLDKPGTVILRFPLGIQSYEFTALPSIESPNDEAIVVQAIGGTVKFNLLFHVYIGRNFPDLKQRLIEFMKAYQLRQYSGSADVLSQLMAGRLKNDLFRPFIDKSANMKVLDIVRKKDEINSYAIKELNDKFNKYGLVFSAAAISSATTVSDEQQAKLNEMVIEDAKLQVLEFTMKEIRPLEEQISKFEQEGKTTAAAWINQANAKKIDKISAAEKERRKLFIDLVGEKNYIDLETMLTMVSNLKQGKTRISIVPDDARIYLGSKGMNE